MQSDSRWFPRLFGCVPSSVYVELAMRPDEIALAIDDDGRAHEPASKSGMGLLGMRERVAALRGRLSFEAGPNGGSALRVVIPLPAADQQMLERAA